MPENYTPAAAATGTWTEEEIRHQPRAWIRSLTNIDALRSALNNFLEPLLRKENLQIILTGAGTSAFIGDIIAPWLASHTGKNFSAVPTTDLVNDRGMPGDGVINIPSIRRLVENAGFNGAIELEIFSPYWWQKDINSTLDISVDRIAHYC